MVRTNVAPVFVSANAQSRRASVRPRDILWFCFQSSCSLLRLGRFLGFLLLFLLLAG